MAGECRASSRQTTSSTSWPSRQPGTSKRIGGSEALGLPYLEVDFVSMVRKRAGWLSALFLGEMLTATAMGYFEKEIERAVVLALFVPLIISSGGNSGSQASTLVIRAMALGEVRLGDWWRVIRREIFAGLVLGAILGSIGLARILAWVGLFGSYGEHYLLVGSTVAVSLIGVVAFGTLAGSLLPFVLRRLGFDPAKRLRAIRRNAGRRNGTRDLLHGRERDLPRHAAVSFVFDLHE
jgi:magnesium transporter